MLDDQGRLKLPEDFVLKHLSVSQLRTYYMCGYRWFFQTASPDRIYAPGWSARLRGSSMDAAANEHYEKKAEDGEGFTLNQFVERAVHEHDQGLDMTMFEREMPETKSKDRTAKLAKEYHTSFGQIFTPRSREEVQETITYETEGLNIPVKGVIDLVAANGMVVDNKVKKKASSQADVHRDFQLTTYAMFKGATDVALAIITDENNPKAVFVPSTRTPENIERLKHRYNTAYQGIMSNTFDPAPEGSWYCNEKWCPYWNICPYGASEVVDIFEMAVARDLDGV